MLRRLIRPGFCALAMLSCRTAFADTTLLVEAEHFQYHGDWTSENDGGTSNGGILRTISADGDAFTVVDVPEAGEYRLWVRARDYTQVEPGKRKFTIVVDDVAAPKEAGAHGKDGYVWELLDTRRLEAGPRVVALRDTGKFYARCDAVMLTTVDFDPNAQQIKELAKFRVKPREVEAKPLRAFPTAAAIDAGSLQSAAVINNGLVRVTFQLGRDADGEPVVVRTTAVKGDGGWRDAEVDPAAERLAVIYAPDSQAKSSTYFPSWGASDNRVALEVAGKRYETSAGKGNPFFGGEPELLVARSVTAVDAATAEVVYVSTSGRKASGVWKVLPGKRDAAVSLVLRADKAGDYSLGLMALGAWPREAMKSNLVPPMFNFQRLPQSPVMLMNTQMPHALALVEAPNGADGSEWAWLVAADPSGLPFEWALPGNSTYGFSQLNAEGLVQPCAFQPVLGMAGSKVKAGEMVRASFRVAALPGDWKVGLAYASSEVFGVTDYREPVSVSMSDAALNMIDLLKEDYASGWEPKLKGLYNIEASDVVTHAAPLAIIEAALLTGDEELWESRALPTIEYTLSRPSAHFATAVPDTFPSYVNEQSIQLKVPSDYYLTAYWQGVDALLGGANPWMAELALDINRQVKHKPTNVAQPRWSELLAGYRLSPSAEKLAEVQREADAWIASEVYGKKTSYLGMSPFYNMQFYPYWWDLTDLYELTREKRYLDAAEECAFHTIAGQWSGPMIPEGETTLHKGGQFEGQDHLWWRGNEKFRLGYPRKPNDTPEKEVPAWVVSNIGLSFEQPSTYFGGGNKEFQQIYMSNWAPNLLRMYEHTGNDIYRTYARNSVIGRWANYPGYYMRGFSDLPQGVRYPYDGPDVTSIYYHHIAPHLAFTIDWLVTDVEVRSGGKIRFPYAKQQGYVWFTNRVFGGPMLGGVFGDGGVRLMLDREKVKVGDKAISTLVGRSAERVWVILTNDAKRDVTTRVAIEAEALGVKTGEMVRMIDASGKEVKTMPFAEAMEIPVAQGGLVALAMEAEEAEVAPALPKVENGHVQQAIAGAWKGMHAFRIRSPFGRDSLYVVVLGRPDEGSTAELTLNSGSPMKVDVYPYEFSVYPLPMDEDVTFSLRLKDAQGVVTEVGPVAMKGSRAGKRAER